MTLMTRREHSGGAAPSATVGITLASATSIALSDATGWPTGAVGPFVVTLGRGTANEERVLCSARTGNNLTVTSRGWDGTVAREHPAQTVAEHTWSTTEADEASAHAAGVAAHGVDVVVGTVEMQTLTNKTLTAPVVNAPAISGGSMTGTITGAPVFSGNPDFTGQPQIDDFTQAGHTHQSAAEAGALAIAATTGLQAALDAKVDDSTYAAEKGAASGIATLDSGTKILRAVLPAPVIVWLGKTVSQSISNTTWTYVDFNVEMADDFGFWSSGSAFTVPAGYGGWYDILVQGMYEGNATGRRVLAVFKNSSSADGTGGVTAGRVNPTPGHALDYDLQASGKMLLADGDVIRVSTWQNSGGALNLVGTLDRTFITFNRIV